VYKLPDRQTNKIIVSEGLHEQVRK